MSISIVATSSTADVKIMSIRSKAIVLQSDSPLSQSRDGSSSLAGQGWAPHKELLRKKYLDEGLTTKEVQQFMLEIHQFRRSIQQYERIFRKWGFKKNLKHKDYEAISRKLIGTSFDIENTEIMANGRFVPFRDLKSRLSRHITPTLALRWSQNVIQRSPNESSAPSCSRRSSEHDEVATRQVLAAGRQICYANNLPWFEFLDILAETYFKSLLLCHVKIKNRISNKVSFKTNVEVLFLERIQDVDWANQVLLTTAWKGLGGDVANDGWVSELQSSNTSPIRLRKILLGLELQIPRRCPNDYEQSIETIVDDHMPAAAFIAMSHLFYLISNQLCHWNVTANCANLLLKANAIPWIKSAAASGAITAKAMLSELSAVACYDRNKDLLKSLIRGENSMDLDTGSHPDRFRSKVKCTLLQDIVFGHLADRNFCNHDDDQQKVLDCIATLVEAGIDLDICSCDDSRRSMPCGKAHSCWRCSPLQLSMMISKGSRLVRYLLDCGANVCRCLNITPMIECDTEVEIDVLQTLLEKGVSSRYVRAPGIASRGYSYQYGYWFPLQAALGQRRSDIATLLLVHNARPDEFSYLQHELTNFDPDNHISEFGSRTNECDLVISLSKCYWLSPLTLSLTHDIELTEVLLELDAPVEDCHYGWLAERTNRRATSPVVRQTKSQEWLDSGHILKKCEERYQTPLVAAVSSGSLRMVKKILARGAIIETPYSESPLAVAARMGRLDLVRLLLDAGAQVDGTFSLRHLRLQRDPLVNYDDDSIDCLVLSPLSEASARDRIDIMTELINRGANTDHYYGYSGVTPLHAAAVCGNYRAVNLLLDHGCVALSHPETRFCSVNAIAMLQWFELHRLSENVFKYDTATDEGSAITMSDERYLYSDMFNERPWSKRHNLAIIDEIFRYKLSSTRSPFSPSYGMEFPMIHNFVDIFFLQSLQSNNVNIAKFLLRQGYVIKFKTSTCLLERLKHQYSKFTADESFLWFVVLLDSQDWSLRPNERLDITEAMYENIMQHVRMRGRQKPSPMFSHLKEKARNMLVECLCDCSKQNPQFVNILLHALEAEELEVYHLLMHHGVNFDHEPRILIAACCHGYGNIVTQLLLSGADVNAQSKDSFPAMATPLDAACTLGDFNIVRALISAGAVISHETTRCTYSSFVIACSHGHVDIVKELIRHRIDIDQPAHGWRAFAPRERDDNAMATRTSLQAACEEGHLDIVTLLINHDADVNAPAGSYRGVTALQAAAIKGHFGIVQRLIGAGARVAAAASQLHGRTAIDGAAEHGRLDMIKYLLDHYDGDEPMSVICWRAAGFAKREGNMVVVELLKSYPGACADEWQDDYTWSSDSDADSVIERPTDQEISDVDIFEFVHEDMVL